MYSLEKNEGSRLRNGLRRRCVLSFLVAATLLHTSEAKNEPRSSIIWSPVPSWLSRVRNKRVGRQRLPPDTSSPFEELSPSISTSDSNGRTASRRLSRERMLEVGGLIVTSMQWGLIAYLGWVIYKAAVDVLEETAQQGEAAWIRQTQDVAKALAFLEQNADTINKAVEEYHQGKKVALPVELTILQVAQRLLTSGLPLRCNASEPARKQSLASVESVLSSITKAEASLLQQCLWIPPVAQLNNEGIRTSWNSVVGLDSIKHHLLSMVNSLRNGKYDKKPHELAFAPLFDRHSAMSSGVLLYGPPGCGKTLLVRTVALRSRIPCLVVTPSVLLRKYVGETNLQVRHLFSVAQKLAPCILCIDELDGLFRERSDSEHEVSRDLKTEFLQWMDGMLSSSNAKRQVLVIGATNRPFDVDSAVLRRLSQSLFIGLPDVNARTTLLQQSLSRVPTASVDLHHVAHRTEGYSPSDLKQLLQAAALHGPMREARPLALHDVERALTQVPPTPLSPRYRTELTTFRGSLQGGVPTGTSENDKWETGWGNFYDVGTIELDHETFDYLQYLMDHLPQHQNENEDDE